MLRVNNLVGFGAGGRLNLIKQGHNISTTTSVNIPACRQGDVGVFLAFSNNGASGSAAAAISTPSGWGSVGSVVYTASGDRHRLQVFRRILTDANSGASLTGASGSIAQTNCVVTLRGNYPVTSLSSGDFEGEVTSDDPAAVTISCSSATLRGVAAFGFHASRNGETRSISFTPTYDTLINDGNDRASVVWKVFPDGGKTDISADTNDSGNGNTFATWFIEAA